MDLHLNPDGPHSDARTREVAEALATCVRVLNNATRLRAGATTPVTVGLVLGELSLALDRCRQLLRQLGDRLSGQMTTGLMYDDRGDPPVRTVAAAREELWEAARDVRALASRLNVAAGIVSHLGLRDEPAGGES